MSDRTKSEKTGGSKTEREKARQAHAASLAAERRRETRFRVLAGLVVVLVVGALIAVPVLTKKSAEPAPLPTTNANASLPKGVNATTFGVSYGTADSSKPELQLWEDFQCPGCAALESSNGAGIVKLADDGKVRLVWRPTTFLDPRFPQSNQSSLRAAMAWGCAIDAGKAAQYHSKVFANQPSVEGTGYTDAQLLDFGKQVGIEGAAYTTFEQCVTSKKYEGWVNNSSAIFNSEGVPGTPTGFLTGKGFDKKELTAEQLSNIGTLTDLIKQATG